ncbi:transcription termination factor NusA [candidate division WWE3 bacterium]|uniref:Transcription termination/antitermination protein NusA n=1 Tax=candidate division WWE3 bacterium TaxID=2053526 RepID=A0A955LGT9_UNCKA|nr:transcription termination factor NusA [candidate division WWE3 bacterium]
MIRSEFMAAINAVASDRGIEPEQVIETLEHALLAAYRKDYGEPEDIVVDINREDGEIKLMREGEDVTPAGFGRIAAQTAKQVILQRVREAEKDAILSDYRDKIDSVVSGMLQRREGHHWMVDIGRTIALMPIEEQVASEDYHQNMRLKFLVRDIRPFRGREMVIVSRSSEELVRGLFEMEVPEVASNAVEIKSISREVGQRSKVAVYTTQEGVDPIGSAVGQRGVRVQAITDELMGEKIDIILWHPDIEKFIVAALSPAKVLGIKVDQKNMEAQVVVPEDQLSLAIGKEGQNVRLAAKLTGYRIDLRSENDPAPSKAGKTEEVESEESAPVDENSIVSLGLSTRTENALLAAGKETLDSIQSLSEEELAEIDGIGPKSVEEIVEALQHA